MSCAGCTDCDPTKYHIHITVEQSEIYQTVCGMIGMKPLRIKNWNSDSSSTVEYIATKSMSGSFGAAHFEMEHIKTLLKRFDIKILRSKIEGPPWVPEFEFAKAMYFEAHLKVPDWVLAKQWATQLRLPMSENLDKQTAYILTGRSNNRESLGHFTDRIQAISNRIGVSPIMIEAALADDNQSLDSVWFKSWSND